MSPKELYVYSANHATKVVMQVKVSEMELPTPDTEWIVRDLLAHMLYELAWGADIVRGKTMREVGKKYDGDLFGSDATKSWQQYAKTTLESVEVASEHATAHLSYADTFVGEYLIEAGNDLLVHAWDLGQAIGIEVVFGEAVARQLYERAKAQEEALRESGLFGKPVMVDDMVDVQTKLLALLGRSRNWVK